MEIFFPANTDMSVFLRDILKRRQSFLNKETSVKKNKEKENRLITFSLNNMIF